MDTRPMTPSTKEMDKPSTEETTELAVGETIDGTFFDTLSPVAQERLSNIKKRYSITVEDVPENLRSDVFGDMFRPVKKVRTGMRAVKASYQAFLWAKEVIVDNEKFRRPLRATGPLVNDDQLLSVVLDYHVKYPEKTVDDFIGHAELFNAVFAADKVVKAITEYVGVRDPAGRVYSTAIPQFRKFADADPLLNYELRKLKLDPSVVREDPAVRGRIARYVAIFDSGVNHIHVTPAITAGRLEHFLRTRTRRESRRRWLQAHCTKLRMGLDDTSAFTAAYLSGREDVDTQEVAAVMNIMKTDVSLKRRRAAISEMRKYYAAGLCWSEALKLAKESIREAYDNSGYNPRHPQDFNVFRDDGDGDG